jgi:hypothetical protein
MDESIDHAIVYPDQIRAFILVPQKIGCALQGERFLAIAAGATGLSTLERGKLFRFTLRHSVILLLAGGLIALAYTYVFQLT